MPWICADAASRRESCLRTPLLVFPFFVLFSLFLSSFSPQLVFIHGQCILGARDAPETLGLAFLPIVQLIGSNLLSRTHRGVPSLKKWYGRGRFY